MPAPSSHRTAFVLKGYPRLSETFIAQEILALERRGLDIVLYSLRHPTDRATHPVHDEIQARVHYLPEYLHREPARVWRAWRSARRNPGYKAAWRLWWRDFRRDPTRNRIRRFGQALVLATELEPGVAHLHAHFLHTPASVARYTAYLKGLPWTVSAHAKDVWTIPEWEKTEKLADCRWLVTCSRANAAHLSKLAPDDRVDLVYHGVDFDRFDNRPEREPSADGPLRLLTVGRAVPKKGHDDLLQALALLPSDVDWRWSHIGGGPMLPALQTLARELGIDNRIEWLGAQPQAAVLAQYRRADLFVLASRIGEDGDRDGLPNVLLEAQSQGVACISTAVSAIPELIEDGVTGLLVPQRDPQALADAIAGLARDPARRLAMAKAGMTRVRADFDLETCIQPLAARFGLEQPPEPRQAHG